jgi:hypothetical protein
MILYKYVSVFVHNATCYSSEDGKFKKATATANALSLSLSDDRWPLRQAEVVRDPGVPKLGSFPCTPSFCLHGFQVFRPSVMRV